MDISEEALQVATNYFVSEHLGAHYVYVSIIIII